MAFGSAAIVAVAHAVGFGSPVSTRTSDAYGAEIKCDAGVPTPLYPAYEGSNSDSDGVNTASEAKAREGIALFSETFDLRLDPEAFNTEAADSDSAVLSGEDARGQPAQVLMEVGDASSLRVSSYISCVETTPFKDPVAG